MGAGEYGQVPSVLRRVLMGPVKKQEWVPTPDGLCTTIDLCAIIEAVNNLVDAEAVSEFHGKLWTLV